MKLYIKGQIKSIGQSYLVFEANHIGEIIYVINAHEFLHETTIKLFIYEYNSDYQKNIYGFKTIKERIIFQDLLTVSGVGPKLALSCLSRGYELLANFIAQGDIASISTFRHMGGKTAKQIVFELQGKYQQKTNQKQIFNSSSQIQKSLKELGFTPKQINYALAKVKPHQDFNQVIESAIKLIANIK